MTETDIQKLCEAIYRKLLAADAGGGDAKWRAGEADRMIAKDGDGGKKFANRAAQYRRMVVLAIETKEELGL